ncbi:hypothetical protein [Paenibacillus dakarensis]|uniref:hypothetical protein n=1 Tax=Paenibacillus dakarensis TaxID=1527293 RepID=UPI0006D55143|nr:hypothetical protein [Paenibacillus dakarensis]
MIFWRGWGIIGILFPILIAGLLAALGFTDENSHWYYFIGLTLSAIPVWFIGKRLNKDKDEIYTNEKTGERFKLGNRHTLFFIPLQYYAIVYPILGIVPFFA